MQFLKTLLFGRVRGTCHVCKKPIYNRDPYSDFNFLSLHRRCDTEHIRQARERAKLWDAEMKEKFPFMCGGKSALEMLEEELKKREQRTIQP